MSLLNWIPKYIKRTINDSPRKRVEASYWNGLWNLVIAQGDNNAAGISKCIEAYKELSQKINAPYPDDGEAASFLTYKGPTEARCSTFKVEAEAKATSGNISEHVGLKHSLYDMEGNLITSWKSNNIPTATNVTPGLLSSALYKKLNSLKTAAEMESAYAYPVPRDSNPRFLIAAAGSNSNRSWGLLKLNIVDENETSFTVKATANIDKDDGSVAEVDIASFVVPQVTSSAAGLMTPALFSKLSGLPNASKLAELYVQKADLTAAGYLKYMGEVADEAALKTVSESNGVNTGHVYKILAKSTYGPANTFVQRHQLQWKVIGSAGLEYFTDAEIDALCEEYL